MAQAQKRSVNTSRAVLKGKMAEQLAPIMPQFEYLPSDAKFLGDPVDYVVFDGYTDLRDGDGRAEDIEIVLIDIKSGGQVNQRTSCHCASDSSRAGSF